MRMPTRNGRVILSILFRKKPWLTVAQLLPAWAGELADDKTNASKVEHDLNIFSLQISSMVDLMTQGPLRTARAWDCDSSRDVDRPSGRVCARRFARFG